MTVDEAVEIVRRKGDYNPLTVVKACQTIAEAFVDGRDDTELFSGWIASVVGGRHVSGGGHKISTSGDLSFECIHGAWFAFWGSCELREVQARGDVVRLCNAIGVPIVSAIA